MQKEVFDETHWLTHWTNYTDAVRRTNIFCSKQYFVTKIISLKLHKMLYFCYQCLHSFSAHEYRAWQIKQLLQIQSNTTVSGSALDKTHLPSALLASHIPPFHTFIQNNQIFATPVTPLALLGKNGQKKCEHLGLQSPCSHVTS